MFFNKLAVSSNNHYEPVSKKNYRPYHIFKEKSIYKAFNFAYDMSFGFKGEHRKYRSGGSIHRKNGEIFINTFQGKLAEMGIYNVFYKNKINIDEPDFETYGLGIWDKYDFKAGDKKISVKSTKNYGQLMLLETKDWTKDAMYKPNISNENSFYDYFILVRIAPSGEDIMKHKRILYENEYDKESLFKIISNKNWSYDIPGFITHDELEYIIRNKYIIEKDAILGTKTTMDAENYYIQAGDMHSIDEIFNLIDNRSNDKVLLPV